MTEEEEDDRESVSVFVDEHLQKLANEVLGIVLVGHSVWDVRRVERLVQVFPDRCDKGLQPIDLARILVFGISIAQCVLETRLNGQQTQERKLLGVRVVTVQERLHR